MRWEVTTAPASEPVALADIEAELEIPDAFADSKLTMKIEAARQDVEEFLNRALITQTITLTLDNWPKKETIVLPRIPFGAITSFNYLDTGGSSTGLVAGTDYRITSNGQEARIIPINSWPSLVSDRNERVTIVYTAGYGSSAGDVPDAIRTALLLHIGWQFSYGQISEELWRKMCKRFIHFYDWSVND